MRFERWARRWRATLAAVVLLCAHGSAHGQGARGSASALEEAKQLDARVISLHGEGRFALAIPFAERALSIRERALGPDHPDVATSLNGLALVCMQSGDYARAEPLHQRALTIREDALGPEHLDVAQSLNNLAGLHDLKGDHAKAEPLYQRALTIREDALGPEHPLVANSLGNLASLYVARGDHARAERLHLRALAIRERALGQEHPEVAASLNNLGLLYATIGDHAKAEPLYKRALAIVAKTLGPEHPHVAASLNNLAGLHEATGDYATAEALYQRALTILERALGQDHPEVATSLDNLASLCTMKADYVRAEALYGRALGIREEALGPEHPHVAASLNNLGLLHKTRGDYAKAEPLYQRARAIFEQALGPAHPGVAASLNNLASLYAVRGEYAKAEPLHRRALALVETALGPEHPHVAGSLDHLASLYRAQGDYAKAEPLYQRALAIRVKSLGPEHSHVAASLSNLAALCHARGDYAKAGPLFRRALTIREKALGPDHPDVATSLSSLAALYLTRGEHPNAEPLLRRALTILEKALGPEHPDLAASLDTIAGLYLTRGDLAKAEPLFQRALTIVEKALGPDHPEVALSLNNLAVLYDMRGDSARAERLHRRALAAFERTPGPDHPDVALSLNNLVRLYVGRHDTAKAIRLSRRAVEIEDRNAAVLLMAGSDEQKRAYMDKLSSQTSGTVSLHVQHAPDAQDAKGVALTTIIRRKGRALEAMASSFAALRRRLGEADRQYLDRLGSVSARYSALAWRGPGSISFEEYHSTLGLLDDERQKVEAEISSRSAELQIELRPVTLEQVKDALPEGASLVELFRYRPLNAKARRVVDWWGEARYVAYVLRRDGHIGWADLGDAALIEAAVKALLPALRRSGADHREPARALDALVMHPIRRLLGDSRWVFLSPDGALNLVPFAALRDEDGRYLLERYAFTYLTSGRDLVRLTATAPSRQEPVVLAAPDFSGATAPAPDAGAKHPRSVDLSSLKFGPLPFAAEEGRAIGRKLQGSRLLMGAAATEGALKALQGPRLLHIATHGFFLPDQEEADAPAPHVRSIDFPRLRGAPVPMLRIENPLLRSGLVLAGFNHRQSGQDDGVLTALEASQLDLHGTKLVVLSACETGVGEARSGDGVYGLRRSLVMAGAETQVMSLWKVNDAATREQMEAYYGRLLAGEGRSEAMRQVQLAMLQDPARAHPYYWASFIVSGNPATLDGRAVAPKLVKVEPGPRGCGCEVPVASGDRAGAWAAVLGALLAARRRRKRRC